MRDKMIKLAALMMVVMSPNIGYSQSESDNIVPSEINKSVYEVIAPKPLDDPITYEKPLPLDLLPFTIRNDKYYSIGTAFAINDTEFVTAAHVTGLGLKSQFKGMFLRDGSGHVFAFDQIIKFSSRRDFIVFTVKDRSSKEHLEVNPNAQINEKVYAVGNALGEGIVIRDGLYTSNTPEQIDGKWNYIRFSAAASPGNSGGPLLDHHGKVIGVIERKSQNENLNVALPISEVLKEYDHFAEVFYKGGYNLDIFDVTKTESLDTKVKLPMTFDAFNNTLIDLNTQFNKKLLKDLISENEANIFPHGDGSKKLFYKISTSSFPELISRLPDGNWDTFPPEKTFSSDLGNNGNITRGFIKNTAFYQIHKPDSISLNDFYSDPKILMDLILKSTPSYRPIGPENIRMISLGKAESSYIHTDSYGRKWLVKTWLIPVFDTKVVTFSLPTPGGCVTLLRQGQTGMVHLGQIPDLEVLTDFVWITFEGTLKQWKEYLELKQLLPALFNDIEITIHDGMFRYKSKRFEFIHDSDVMKLNDQSALRLDLAYYKDKAVIGWNVSRIFLNQERYKMNGITITRNMKPTEDLGDKYLDNWKKLVEESKPNDMKIYSSGDNTAINAVYKNFSPMKRNETFSVLYRISYSKVGIVDQNEMESAINKVIKKLTVFEN